jgi:hypothetical protein
LLTELVLLTTVSVLIFGFLLNSGSHTAHGAEQGVYVLAMITVSSATMVFILPVAYHHIEFPYENFDRFVSRTHRWVLTGLPLLGAGLYLSLCLAIWTLFHAWSLLIAAGPFVATATAFVMRKGKF